MPYLNLFLFFLFYLWCRSQVCIQFMPDFTPSFMFYGSCWQYYQNARAQWIHPPARWQCPHVLNAPARPLQLPSQHWRNAFSACTELDGIRRDTAFSAFCFKVFAWESFVACTHHQWIHQRVLIHWSISTIHNKHVGFVFFKISAASIENVFLHILRFRKRAAKIHNFI